MGKKATASRPRVYARIRPMFGRDAGQPELFTVSQQALEFKKEGATEVSRFEFDRVFGMDAKQEEVFEEIGDTALQSLRSGFNSTILAYGQTGSGKTFSMEGAKDDKGKYVSRGLIPRIFEDVFKIFKNDTTVKKFEVSIQFIELYNEQLQDLLGKRKVVDTRMDPTGGCAASSPRPAARSPAPGPGGGAEPSAPFDRAGTSAPMRCATPARTRRTRSRRTTRAAPCAPPLPPR